MTPDDARAFLAVNRPPSAGELQALRAWHATQALHAQALATTSEPRSPAVRAKHLSTAANHERATVLYSYLDAMITAHLPARHRPGFPTSEGGPVYESLDAKLDAEFPAHVPAGETPEQRAARHAANEARRDADLVRTGIGAAPEDCDLA